MTVIYPHGACEDCGDWTGHGGTKLCVDCKRKRKNKLTTCEYPSCGISFKPPRAAVKYCIAHRALSPSERP